MFGSKKYINSINAKGIFDNTYETKLPQTVASKVILNHFEKSDKIPKCILSVGTVQSICNEIPL